MIRKAFRCYRPYTSIRRSFQERDLTRTLQTRMLCNIGSSMQDDWHSEQTRMFVELLSAGNVFQQLTNQYFRKVICDGAENNKTLDNVLPFLKDTGLENIQCSEIKESIFNTRTRITKRTAKQQWMKILDKIPPYTITDFEDESYSPDSMISFPIANENKRVHLCIQSKNDEISLKELHEDIKKISNLLCNKQDEVIFVSVGSEVSEEKFEQKIWYAGEPFQASDETKKSTRQQLIPKRMTVVLITGQKLGELFGSSFTDILFRFNKKKIKKDTFYPVEII